MTGPTFDRADVSGNVIRRSDPFAPSTDFTLWRALYIGPLDRGRRRLDAQHRADGAGQFVVVGDNFLVRDQHGTQARGGARQCRHGWQRPAPFSPAGSLVEMNRHRLRRLRRTTNASCCLLEGRPRRWRRSPHRRHRRQQRPERRHPIVADHGAEDQVYGLGQSHEQPRERANSAACRRRGRRSMWSCRDGEPNMASFAIFKGEKSIDELAARLFPPDCRRRGEPAGDRRPAQGQPATVPISPTCRPAPVIVVPDTAGRGAVAAKPCTPTTLAPADPVRAAGRSGDRRSGARWPRSLPTAAAQANSTLNLLRDRSGSRRPPPGTRRWRSA